MTPLLFTYSQINEEKNQNKTQFTFAFQKNYFSSTVTNLK